MEVWKDIPGYEGKYQISNKGRVKSLPRDEQFCKRPKEVILKTFVCGSGYQEVILRNKGKRKPKLIHRMVAEAFVPNHANKEEVNHKDGDKFNNVHTNLEWVTPKENIRHSYDVLPRKKNGKKVVCIETGEVFDSLKEAADKYGLQLPLIWKCCNGKQKTTGGYRWGYKEAE